MKAIVFLSFVFFCSLVTNGQDAEERSDGQKRIDSLHRLASTYFRSDADSAVYFAEKALSYAKQEKDARRKAGIYVTLSNIHHRQGDIKKAFEYIELAEIVSHECDDEFLTYRVKSQKGALFSNIGNVDAAVRHLAEAEKGFTELGDSSSLAVTLNAMSSIYAKSGDYDQAIDLIHRAIGINRESGRKRSLGANLGNLALYYQDTGEYEKAKKEMRNAIRLFKEVGSMQEMSSSVLALAGINIEQKHYDSALLYMNEAADLILDSENPTGKIDYWNMRGGYEMNQLKNYDKAYKLFKQSYALSQQIGIPELTVKALQGLYESSKFAGNNSQALVHFEQFKKLSDSLAEISGDHALMAMELNQRFEHEQKLAAIEKQELETKRQNTELAAEKKNYIILSLILAGILIAFVAIILVRRKQRTIKEGEQQQQQLSDELELRNKELVSSAIQILRKNEEMKKTIASLEELNERAEPEDSMLLLTIIRKLKFELEHSSWEEFEVPFKKLHMSFYNKLVEKYPELTRAEIKVCSLLKLNLDTKQISSILHKTPASIEVDRSRIRKKMGLTNTKTSLTRHINTNI